MIRETIHRLRDRAPDSRRATVALACLLLLVGIAGPPAMATLQTTLQPGDTFDAPDGPTVVVNETVSVASTDVDGDTVSLGDADLSGGEPVTTNVSGLQDHWLRVEPALNGSRLSVARANTSLSATISGDNWVDLELAQNASAGDGTPDARIGMADEATLAISGLSGGEATLSLGQSDIVIASAPIIGGTATFDGIEAGNSLVRVETSQAGSGSAAANPQVSEWTQGNWLAALFAPYVNLLGAPLVATVLGGALIMSFWIFSGSLAIPAIILLLLGGVLLPVLPGEVLGIARALLVLGMATALLAVARKWVL